ncbi:hypothetical protein UF69_2254 [Staphylococcus haemolyticus]|nr:hypothetical protein UF69_2254 [Staphylococcus haemolyticus]
MLLVAAKAWPCDISNSDDVINVVPKAYLKRLLINLFTP